MLGKLWPLLATLVLCACGHIGFFESHDREVRADAPFFFMRGERPTDGDVYLENEKDVYRPMQAASPADMARPGYRGADSTGNDSMDNENALVPSEPAVPRGCSLRDRFDKDSVVAYNFSDGQSKLALHMNMGSMGFNGVEVDKVELKFHFRLQPIKTHDEKCRYPSNFQGLVGSGYHEFIERQHNTVWDNIRDQNPLGLFGR